MAIERDQVVRPMFLFRNVVLFDSESFLSKLCCVVCFDSITFGRRCAIMTVSRSSANSTIAMNANVPIVLRDQRKQIRTTKPNSDNAENGVICDKQSRQKNTL